MKSVFNKKVLCLVVVVLLLTTGTALAAEFEPMAYQYFLTGTVQMGKQSDGSLYLYGRTMAKQEVSRTNVTIYLQAYINGAWVNIWSDGQTAYGASTVDITRGVKVPKGQIYRLYAEHNVYHQGVSETDYSYTGSLIVN